MREKSHMLPLLVLAVVVAAHSPTFALADPCSAQLGYPIVPAAYASAIVTVIVPLSASCSTSYGSQLYATATAYDLNTNTSAGTVSSILTSENGGYTFTGQLGFNLPASMQGHWVQITVTIYSGRPSNALTTGGEAFQVNPETFQVVTTTVTQSTPSEFAPTITQRPRVLFAYVAIAAILATVIIATVGLVVYSRRPAAYYQVPSAY